MHITIDSYTISCTTEFISYEMELHVVESCVHGFHLYPHLYQDIWTPTTGECLSCQTEDSNTFDPYARLYNH